ncbi:MAG: OsmC family protein [Gemmatimonadaceae bacterium]|nr:OsmC family protein [Gemmatimonadaceae bacterium]
MQIKAEWQEDQQFDTGRPGGPMVRLDGTGGSGQSPMDALLSALAACAGIDVVEILGKRRTPPERFTIEVTGTRRDTPPRRYTHITVRFVIDGDGIDAVHAERAIALAFEKYCSVSASLATDIEVTSVLVLNGEEQV